MCFYVVYFMEERFNCENDIVYRIWICKFFVLWGKVELSFILYINDKNLCGGIENILVFVLKWNSYEREREIEREKKKKKIIYRYIKKISRK